MPHIPHFGDIYHAGKSLGSVIDLRYNTNSTQRFIDEQGSNNLPDSFHQLHDKLFRQVLSDPDEVEAFLRAHLPETVAIGIRWTTLRRIETTFIDEVYQKRESDLLYIVEHDTVEEPIYLYLLFEHQSTPDRWIRRRLWTYIDRIWDESFKQDPSQHWLKPILPLVFYQGKDQWNYTTNLRDLFPEEARDWPFLPSLPHYLVNQFNLDPKAVTGGIKAQVMQLLMLAAFHESMEEALQLAAELLPQVPRTGGIDFVRVFFIYLIGTQPEETVDAFAAAVRQRSSEIGGELMTYGQQLLEEGREEGRKEGQAAGLVKAIELGLELKFGTPGLQLLPFIHQIRDIDVLLALYEGIKTAQNLEEMRELYQALSKIE